MTRSSSRRRLGAVAQIYKSPDAMQAGVAVGFWLPEAVAH